VIGAFGFLSEYNLLESVFRLEDIIDYASNEKYPFIALADSNNLYGSYKLFKHAKTPYIIGMKLDIVHLEQNTSILVYALNDKGFKHLIILSSLVQLNENKRLQFKDILPYKEGLYFISSGHESDIDINIQKGLLDEAKTRLSDYKNNLPNFSVGLALQTMNQEIQIAPHLKVIAKEENVLLLPLNYMSYLKEDWYAYDVFIQIQNIGKKRLDEMDLSFLTLVQIEERFSDYKEVFSNLEAVFKKFEFNYQKPQFHLVSPIKSKDHQKALHELAYAGLNQIIDKGKIMNSKPYFDRLSNELNVIDSMGYNDYFLIVWDFVKFAKEKGILVGPGRGSAAGSLTSYALQITNVDPLKYGLLFERFLNKDRRNMPDIDLDFPDDRRDEVIQYVKDKYGSNHVLSINTFSKFASKSSIRDIARIKGYTPSDTNQIVKRIIASPDQLDGKLNEILTLSNRFEGLPRQTGTHAAGIIMAKEDLRYYIPLQQGPMIYQSQYEHEDLDDMGILKIDFLGIRNLNMINRMLELIEKHQGIKLDLDTIDYEDAKTYALLSSGDSAGIFQLESQGMRSVLRKLKPTHFNDIVALLALYRPGPMQNIDTYIERRNGAKFNYIDPLLEPILKDTYGIIIYQEQIMMIAQRFAGYSLNEADLLRVGVSKKDKDILEREKERFITRSVENGKTKELAITIYDYILKFADYGFNKSHSVAYGIVAYQMAYLKANYYPIFMSVLMSKSASSDLNTFEYIKQLNNKGVVVLPPDINLSTNEYEIKDSSLVYPLTGIKSIGQVVAGKIIDEREINGSYQSYSDLKERLKGILTPRVLEGLIFSGALDSFGLTKRTLFDEQNSSVQIYQTVVFDIKETNIKEYPLDQLIEKEKEALGFNLSYAPVLPHEDLIEKRKLTPLSKLTFKVKQVKTLGLLKQIREITTKKGDPMAFVDITDYLTVINATIFPEVFNKIKSKLEPNTVYIFTLEAQNYQGGKWILADLEVINE
jgi:DNA polymerase-3 subunit alpha